MDTNARIDEALKVMTEFADQTGLSNDGMPPRRYLWTDAFAVCNFLTLYRETGDEEFRHLALDLIAQVHTVLGRHRHDDARTGWISGLDEAAGAGHPTAGGLRIGKALNERQPGEAFDERLEWDRDGQYFHYLTKWMHALERAGSVSAEPRYVLWAIELAKAAHRAFAYVPSSGGFMSMHWKMSIDLSRPLVPSMGLHDPLDAFVTYNELQHCIQEHPRGVVICDLDREIAETAAMCKGKHFSTDDPLGIGGLLFDACRLTMMTAGGRVAAPGLAEALLLASKRGLESFLRRNPLNDPADYRLAFREMGLSIGLHALEKMRTIIKSNRSCFDDGLLGQTESMAEYLPLNRSIERFWRDPANQRSEGWRAHRDINKVMLATSLAPGEFLSL